MKRNRFMGAGLLLALAWTAHGAASGGNPPAYSAAQIAELQRLENDPRIQRETAAWRQASTEATRQHLRAVAAQGDARDLLAASMLWSGLGIWDGTTAPTPAAPAQETRTWFDAARRARPREVLVAWMEASDCAGLSDSCNPGEALQFLLQAEPDNAAVQLLALAAADKRGDRKAAEVHWQAAASATRYDPHMLEIGQLLHAAMRDVPQPPLGPHVAETMGVRYGLGRPVTAREVADVGLIGITSALAMPGFLSVTRQCAAEALAKAGDTRAIECARIMTLLAGEPSTLIAPMIGLPAMVRLSGDTQEGKAWRERLRQFYWVYENGLQRLPGLTPGSPLPAEYGTWFLTEGELPAMRKLLQHHGLPSSAPADWLPRDPRYRALVTTGREPAPAG